MNLCSDKFEEERKRTTKTHQRERERKEGNIVSDSFREMHKFEMIFIAP